MRWVAAAAVLISLVPARWLAAAAAPIDEGIQFLEDRVKSDPDDFIAQNQLANRYLKKLRETGDYTWLAAARRSAETSLAAVPPESNPAGLGILAHSQLAAHRLPEAVARAHKLAALAPGKISSFAVLGGALLEHGDRAEAKAAYEKMERLDPVSLETYSRRARLALL